MAHCSSSDFFYGEAANKGLLRGSRLSRNEAEKALPHNGFYGTIAAPGSPASVCILSNVIGKIGDAPLSYS
jgi:hypothetical protein